MTSVSIHFKNHTFVQIIMLPDTTPYTYLKNVSRKLCMSFISIGLFNQLRILEIQFVILRINSFSFFCFVWLFECWLVEVFHLYVYFCGSIRMVVLVLCYHFTTVYTFKSNICSIDAYHFTGLLQFIDIQAIFHSLTLASLVAFPISFISLRSSCCFMFTLNDSRQLTASMNMLSYDLQQFI